MGAESALLLFVPEAEPLVSQYRDPVDVKAGRVIPAHFTVLYPFVPPDQLDDRVLAQLTKLFADCAPFEFVLTELRRFPEVLYLAPVPDEPIRALTEKVQVVFPDYQNYGGAFATIIPHVTVARVADPRHLAEIEWDFTERFGTLLPIRVQAREVALVENTLGQWKTRVKFFLAKD